MRNVRRDSVFGFLHLRKQRKQTASVGYVVVVFAVDISLCELHAIPGFWSGRPVVIRWSWGCLGKLIGTLKRVHLTRVGETTGQNQLKTEPFGGFWKWGSSQLESSFQTPYLRLPQPNQQSEYNLSYLPYRGSMTSRRQQTRGSAADWSPSSASWCPSGTCTCARMPKDTQCVLPGCLSVLTSYSRRMTSDPGYWPWTPWG